MPCSSTANRLSAGSAKQMDKELLTLYTANAPLLAYFLPTIFYFFLYKVLTLKQALYGNYYQFNRLPGGERHYCNDYQYA